jgi:hypothetical protein
MQIRKYYTMENVGHAKYTVNFHDGKKTHKDGSPFYNIRIFTSKVKLGAFVRELEANGYGH